MKAISARNDSCDILLALYTQRLIIILVIPIQRSNFAPNCVAKERPTMTAINTTRNLSIMKWRTIEEIT